ncbi:MAG: beta-ketoacyl-ACP synthase II [Pygmaiobacter massiliensis]|nr:beta-ketoacyl-ACP synthase II [Pygmaiobacter massiliensis]
MERRRVVITGLGTVNPLGNDTNAAWTAAKAGVCGIGPITQFDTADFKVKLAAEVKNFNPDLYLEKREQRKLARFVQFALAAACQAAEDAGLDMSQEKAERCGVIVSSGIGGLPVIEAEHTRGSEHGFEKISPYFVPMAITNMAAAQVAIRFGMKGICSCPVTACAGGTNAVGDAFHRIRDGYEEVIFCGGSESCISPLGIGGFASMKALSTQQDPACASVPFDARRSGFVMGEGSGVLLLEELQHAKARGAHIYAEIVGYGANCDAYHFTAPAPGGAGGAACMQLALADAGVLPDQVDYINAHGTSTHLNDSCESAAIRTAFGPWADKLCVSSTKSMTGHLLGGAGGVEAVFTALALQEGFVPPTIHYEQPDPECDLYYVPNQGEKRSLRYAMSNSLGFGGHNASILLRRWEEKA